MRCKAITTLLVAAILVGTASGCSSTQSDSVSDAGEQEYIFSGKAAYDLAVQYSEFGIHRTGTDTEIASTKWIADELENAGLEVELQELSFKRFDLEECTTMVDGAEIESFPFWFPVATGEDGVEAPLTFYNEEDPASMEGKIVYYDMPGMQTNGNIVPIAEKAKEAGALAVISTVIHPNGRPSAQNTVEGSAEKSTELPAVIVSVSKKEALTAAAEQGATASVKITGNIVEDAVSYNVVGRLDNGADRWVVVTTPVSGWFTCHAERGSGVGIFLELAKTVSSWEYPVNYLFLGNTGHELSFMGAHASKEFTPPPEDVEIWVHLGSAIAAKEPIMEGYEFLGFSEDIGAEVEAYFEDVPGLVVQNNQEKLMQSELGNIIGNGYSCFGLYGANKDFHTAADMADGISVEEMENLGKGVAGYLKNSLGG